MTLRMIALAAALGLASAAGAAPPAAQATTPPAAKGITYDCTKTGNKDKKACKSVTQGGVAAAAKPSAAAPVAAKAPAKPIPVNAVGAPKTPMNYDCTKAGNKNKAVCKNVVVPPAGVTAAKPTAAVPAAKPMAMAPAAAPAAMAPAKPAAAAPAAKPARASAAVKATNPNEVTATLKNGQVVHYDCSKAGNKDKKACAGK